MPLYLRNGRNLGLARLCGRITPPIAASDTIGPADTGSTIAIEVRKNDRLSLFLFAYHAARAECTLRLRGGLALEAEDNAGLQAHGAAFAPLAAAFEPYLDKHPLFDRSMLFMIGSLAGADAEFSDPAMVQQFVSYGDERYAPRLPRSRARNGFPRSRPYVADDRCDQGGG